MNEHDSREKVKSWELEELDSSAMTPGQLELALNIAWWKAARERAIENVDSEYGDSDDQPHAGFSLSSFSGSLPCPI